MMILGLAAFAAFLYFLAVAPREATHIALVAMWGCLAGACTISVATTLMR